MRVNDDPSLSYWNRVHSTVRGAAASQWWVDHQELATMTSVDDFRLDSYTLLLELDAATTSMMMLVSSRHASGPEWDKATKRHSDACEVWSSFLSAPINSPSV